MKKWIVGLLIIVAAVCFHPFHAFDPGELCVAQTLLVEAKDDQVTLWALEQSAQGETTAQAANVMAEAAPGELFLRQTKRIIFCGGAEFSKNALKLPEEIPMGAIVYQCQDSGEQLSENLEELEAVLEARERRERQLPTLAQLKNGRAMGAAMETETLTKETEP